MNSILLIPSLNPDNKLIDLIKKLKENHFKDIVIVNDGSSKEYDKYFKEAKKLGAIVLTYSVNKGKGGALKTGFRYIENNYKNAIGIITLDADGQHKVNDVIKISQELNKSSNLILGIREVTTKKAPLRSRFGNYFSIKYFKLKTGVHCLDTQTGLRGIPMEYIELALSTEGDRYEYEMNFLIDCANKHIPFIQIPIETVYEDNNKGSHFKTISDSWLIYRTFFMKIFTILIAYILEFINFSIIVNIFSIPLFAVALIPKIVFILIYLILTRILLYRLNTITKKSIIKCTIYILASIIVLLILNNTIFSSLVLTKLLIDFILFIFIMFL